MDGASSTFGEKEKRTQGFRWEKLKGREPCEDHGVNVNVILKCILEI
jgi:hypothetical protein